MFFRRLLAICACLLLLGLAVVLLPTQTRSTASDIQPRAWLPITRAITNAYLLDIFVYPEEPQIGGEFFVLAFGHGKPCYDLEYDRTIDGQNILIEARLVGWSGVCGVDWALDWGILERVSIRFITTHDGEVWPQPGEWTAEVRLVLIPEYWIDSKSIAFTHRPSLRAIGGGETQPCVGTMADSGHRYPHLGSGISGLGSLVCITG